MTIAVLGPKNTFSDLARQRHWPKSKPLYASSIAQVFKWVEKSKAKAGLVPIKNSLSGVIRQSSVGFKKRKVRIQKKVSLSIELALAGVKKVPLSKLRIIYSHPQALLQCQSFLHKQCPHAKTLHTKSTVQALKRVKTSGNLTIAGIASCEAIRADRLVILKNSIQGCHKNVTFFALITPPQGSF